jgi:DNA-binding NarL/FixJ family response regulator
MEKIRIGIVDDQHLFRKGLAALIEGITNFELVAEAEGGNVLLEKLASLAVLPDVILVDMNMPEMNGIELATLLHNKYPDIKIIVLTVHDQERFISKMIQCGACGYLVKNAEIDELVDAINTVHETGFYLNDLTLKAMANASKYKSDNITNINNIPVEITKREHEILQMICKQWTNSEIADKLFVSVRTVDGHRNNLLAKTGCRNTAGLVLFAVSNGLYDLGFQ